MKDSGIEWIGEIPKNWNLTKIGMLYNLRNIKVSDSDYPPLSVTKMGILPQLENVAKTNAHDDRKLVKVGDFVINSRSDRRGSCGISDYDGSASLINTVLTPNAYMHSGYYGWLFKTAEFADEFYKNGHGIVDDLWTTGWQEMKRIVLPVPSLNQQCYISDYLDSKCSEIDATSEEIQKQISILEDYKKSVITEAVTKGLNPNVEMKDSGVEWIGEIPKNWDIEKIKYHLKREEFRNPGNMEVLSVYRDYGVVPKNSRDDNHNVTSDDTSKYKHLKKGDLVINKMKAWQGSLAVSYYEGIVSPAYYIYKFSDEVFNKKYFHYLIRSCYKDEFRRLSGGIREGQWDLSAENFENTLVLIPSLPEQKEIVDYLDSKCSEIDSLISEKKQQLTVLADYKKSLIYEYVTGKKEVPAYE